MRFFVFSSKRNLSHTEPKSLSTVSTSSRRHHHHHPWRTSSSEEGRGKNVEPNLLGQTIHPAMAPSLRNGTYPHRTNGCRSLLLLLQISPNHSICCWRETGRQKQKGAAWQEIATYDRAKSLLLVAENRKQPMEQTFLASVALF